MLGNLFLHTVNGVFNLFKRRLYLVHHEMHFACNHRDMIERPAQERRHPKYAEREHDPENVES